MIDIYEPIAIIGMGCLYPELTITKNFGKIIWIKKVLLGQ